MYAGGPGWFNELSSWIT